MPVTILWSNLEAAYRRFFFFLTAEEWDQADKQLDLIRELAGTIKARA
jgi:hypothetical protein